MALATGTFRWEGFTTTEDLVNHVAGGILMGFGGVTALGCTSDRELPACRRSRWAPSSRSAPSSSGASPPNKYQMWQLERAA